LPQESFTDVQGQVRLLSTTKIPFEASGVNTPCVLGVSVDITEYKNAEESIGESRQFIDSILNSTPNFIYVYDLVSKKNIYYNREILNSLGYTLQQIEEMGDQFFTSLLHPEDEPRVVEQHRPAIWSQPQSSGK